MALGYVSEKSMFEQNPVLPRLRHRINDDVSYPPSPYRILKSMLRGPGLLSGYTFHMMRSEKDKSGKSSLLGEAICIERMIDYRYFNMLYSITYINVIKVCF